MLKICAIVLATASYVSPASVSDSNTFVDTIFKKKMPPLVRESPRLYPYAVIGDFRFKVYSSFITNRDLKVNMTRGEVQGLDTAVQRRGDCHAPYLRGRRMVIACNLAIPELNITFTSLAKGDSLIADWKTIWVNLTVADSLIQFEANAPVDHDVGVLRLFLVKDIHFDVAYDSNLSLNRGRQEKFKQKISDKVNEELKAIFLEYMTLLSDAVQSVPFPKA